ncbi:hypothetical protein [Mycolicibacterium sp. XJ1819]
MTESLDLRAEKIAIWAGLISMLLLFGGGYILSGLVIPPSAMDSSEAVVARYIADIGPIRIGCFLMVTGFSFVSLWGCALASLTRHVKGHSSVITYTQVTCIAAVLVIVLFIPMMWAIAAFRPGEIAPDITVSISDIGWFLFLYPWPPLMIWLVVTGWTILTDNSAEPVFPRWAGYLCLWTALCSVAGGLMSFFKDGPFSWSGVFAYLVPLGVFFIWMVSMSTVMLRAIKQLETPSTEPLQRVSEPIEKELA